MEKFYCVKCKDHIEVDSYQQTQAKNGKPMFKSICPKCGTTVCKFVKQK